jgi:hypothetical protein
MAFNKKFPPSQIPSAEASTPSRPSSCIILKLREGKLHLFPVVGSDEEFQAILLALQNSIICGDFAELAGL